MKKCPKCGTECSDDANFCTQCHTVFDSVQHGVKKVIISAKLSMTDITVYEDDSFEINCMLSNIYGDISDIVSCRLEDAFPTNLLILQLKQQERPLKFPVGLSLPWDSDEKKYDEDLLRFIHYVHDTAPIIKMEALMESRKEEERLESAIREAQAKRDAERAERAKRDAEERAALAKREAERIEQEKREAEEREAQAKREAAAKVAKARRAKMASTVSEAIASSDGEQKALLSALYLIYETLKDINARLANQVSTDALPKHGAGKKKVHDLAFDDAYDIAQEHFNNSRMHEARDVLKKLRDEYEPDYDVLYHLAICYLDLRRKEQGIETINEAKALNERDPRAYKVLAMIYQDQDVNKALAEIDEAIYLDPSDARSHVIRAEIMMRGEEPQGVLESCNRAIGLAPNLPDPYVMICKVAKFIKDEKLYKETLDKLEKVDSSAADHVKQLFYKSLTQKLEEAVDAIEEGAWKLAGPSIRMQNIGNMFGVAFRRD